MRANAGARITDIASLIGEAFIKVAQLEMAVSDFKYTGIYPFDRNIFSDWLFSNKYINSRPERANSQI